MSDYKRMKESGKDDSGAQGRYKKIDAEDVDGPDAEKKINTSINNKNDGFLSYKETKGQTDGDSTQGGESEKPEDVKEEEDPAAKKERLKKANQKAKEILGQYVSRFRCLVFSGVVLQILGMSGEIAFPLFVGMTIDAVETGSLKKVMEVVTKWMMVTAFGSFFSGLQAYLFTITNHRFGHALRKDLFEQIIRKDVEFFDSRKTGDLISRMQSDVQKIQDALSNQFGQLIKSTLFCLIAFCIFIYISWQMTIVTIGFMLPILCILPHFGRYMRKVHKGISDTTAKASETAEESFSNIRTVKAFATEDHQSATYYERNESVYNTSLKAAYGHGFWVGIITFFMFGGTTCLIFFASFLYFNYGLSIGDFSSFQFYMFSFLINFGSIASVIGNVMGVQGTMTAIAEIYMYVQKIPIEGGDDLTTDSLKDGSVSLKNIKFHYPGKSSIQVIKDASIVVEKNKTVALVGSSGCGKSTIIQLVERFYDPVDGKVSYGQQDLKELDPRCYKEHMAIVQQEPILFSGTIRENIVYGLRHEATQMELDEACRHANVLDFVTDENIFPLGYETVVGERGVKLSGGQKQRIAIARALIRKPKVLLLDEATSALDAESEHQVQAALDNVLQNEGLQQTVIVIAHRLSTIKDADEIIVLQKGVIVERGTHDELLEKGKKGVYRKLVERQLMKIEE